MWQNWINERNNKLLGSRAKKSEGKNSFSWHSGEFSTQKFYYPSSFWSHFNSSWKELKHLVPSTLFFSIPNLIISTTFAELSNVYPETERIKCTTFTVSYKRRSLPGTWRAKRKENLVLWSIKDSQHSKNKTKRTSQNVVFTLPSLRKRFWELWITKASYYFKSKSVKEWKFKKTNKLMYST